ncbi:inactive tyrosine-protein kinase PRAG1 isoform X2 [Electrophorus electricus]|uniref:inactive tyrosine-protein kinase PRAG1 isoform X2 n=1 Tax=Electrophorus electricus TaxID=8005 RepID=UPI0015CFD357|nr:inactive tyrosine-protein kinase PRAG1 isoform X2 [Electrophorus electricus]
MDCTLLRDTTARSSCAPPALPMKQHRSQSSSASSVSDLQLEGGTCDLSGNSSPASPFTDVFATPTDCHAAQCPIHHCGGEVTPETRPRDRPLIHTEFVHQGHHKERFFSDETPPPIPKKKLVRTLSLHNPALEHSSPCCCRNSHCEAKDYQVHHAGEWEKECALKTHYLNRFDFETLDHHLDVSGSFYHQEQVYAGIQNSYLQFMRNTVRHLETMVLLDEQEVDMVRRLQPEDCLLCEDEQPMMMEQEIFFTVIFPKVPTRCLSAKVNRKGSVFMHSKPVPHHPNTEEIIAHFPPQMTKEKLQLSQIPASTDLSREGSTEPCQESDITKGCPLLSYLERGITVSIVRDFPWGTLEDFVQEGVSLYHSRPDVYERRLCLLMLQLVQGLCHLGVHDGEHGELAPQRIMLVWRSTRNKGPAKKAEAPAEHKRVMKRDCLLRHSNVDKNEGSDEVLCENISMRKVHVSWGRWGAPRVVISQAQCSQDLPSKELQLGRLLKHCLHQDAHTRPCTQYTPGLRHLIQQLTSETPGLQVADTAGVLQAVLWGPPAGLFERNQASTATVLNWLMVKRSLLVLKLAEKGLLLPQSGLDWEDYLCLQYLSSTDPEAVLETAVQLGFCNTVTTTKMANTNTKV